MKKIVIGGQIDKDEIAKDVQEIANGIFEVDVMSDLDAAMAVKNGERDYYIGACNTGGGGALAMALALVGADACVTLSMPGNVPSEEKIIEEVQSGKVAFGFTAEHRSQVLPILVAELVKKGDN